MRGRAITSVESAAPYKLREILLRHQIEQSDLRARIKYESGSRAGNTMAAATLSTLITRRKWPVTIEADAIKAATAELLRERGVPEEEIETAWVIDGQVDAHAAPQQQRNRRKNPEAKPEPQEAPFELPEAEMLSPAARQQFNLARHPFIDDVQGPQDVYLSREQRYIRETMYYAAKHGGFVAVVGESGSGKSTLRRDLIDRIKRDNESIVVIQPQIPDKETMTTSHICDAIVADLSTETPRLSLEAKARQVQRILASSAHTGVSHALLIEEAHDLSTPTLKKLKRFWELEDGFRRLLGVILIGQPELKLKLDERRNYDAREVIRRCEVAELKSLNGNLEEYLELKLKRVGVALADVFEKDAFDAMRARLTRRRENSPEVESHLYPLIVNNLVMKAMNAAADLGLPKITGQLVGRL
jgi:type II secretory pathway predicted ATPase ExeA